MASLMNSMEYEHLESGDQDWRWFFKYPEMVVNGEIIACQKVRWMCERHLADLKRDDIYLDVKEAESIVNFFHKHVPITDGDKPGSPMMLDPVQIFISVSLVAWRWSETVTDDDGEVIYEKGLRRYRKLFMLVARKFGKTSWIAGVKLYLMYKGGHAPRVYSLATKLDQAKLAWTTAKRMIDLSPTLRRVFKTRAHDIQLPKKAGEFRALASDSKSLDGLNPIGAILDECHAVTDSNLYGVIGSAFGAQKEYLFSVITTAGFILDGLCTDLYKNGARVLDPNDPITQDDYFYAIYEIDDEDDWTDSKNWYKSNPSLHFGRPSMSYLKGQFQEAQMRPDEKANFITKHCNKFVSGYDKWLLIDEVKKGARDLNVEDYYDKPCTIGVDRGMTNDITSVSVTVPDTDGGVTRFGYNMQCQGAIDDAGDLLQGIYFKAKENNELIIIPGNAVKNSDVKQLIAEVCAKFPRNQGVYFDPWHMRDVATDLENMGYNIVSVSQGTGNMSEPSQTMENLIKGELFRYQRSVLFEYATTCAMIDVTKYNNQRVFRDPKQWKVDKIDPVISTIIALSGATLVKQMDQNVYENRGMLML